MGDSLRVLMELKLAWIINNFNIFGHIIQSNILDHQDLCLLFTCSFSLASSANLRPQFFTEHTNLSSGILFNSIFMRDLDSWSYDVYFPGKEEMTLSQCDPRFIRQPSISAKILGSRFSFLPSMIEAKVLRAKATRSKSSLSQSLSIPSIPEIMGSLKVCLSYNKNT